jgi:hypothetical protein
MTVEDLEEQVGGEEEAWPDLLGAQATWPPPAADQLHAALLSPPALAYASTHVNKLQIHASGLHPSTWQGPPH